MSTNGSSANEFYPYFPTNCPQRKAAAVVSDDDRPTTAETKPQLLRNLGGSAKDHGVTSKIAPKKLPRSRAVVTERDLRALGWIGEQGGATYDTLSVLLTNHPQRRPLSDAGVRQQVERWRSLALVTKFERLGRMWVTPTRAGYDLIGQRFSLWRGTDTKATHDHAVNQTRLWWEANPQRVASQGAWVSERILYAERGQQSGLWHLADGEIRHADRLSAFAVEVELHEKRPRSRYIDVFDRLRPDVAEVLYLCPTPILERVTSAVGWAVLQAGLADVVKVHCRPLPELVMRMHRS